MKKKITIQDIEGLPQLDRIEYRMRWENIRKYYSDGGTFHCINYFSIAIAIMSLIILNMWQVRRESAVELLNMMPLVIKGSIIVVALTIASDIFMSFRKNKLLNELDAHYFLRRRNDKEEQTS